LLTLAKDGIEGREQGAENLPALPARASQAGVSSQAGMHPENNRWKKKDWGRCKWWELRSNLGVQE